MNRKFLNFPFSYRAIYLSFLIGGFTLLGGCKTMEVLFDIGTHIGTAAGVIDYQQAESIRKSTKAVARSFQDINSEQEYYIGRTVGATIVNKYLPYDNKAANLYLNTLGQTLAQASDMPETFGGYHFLILDSDEINAFAAPGGLIFVTRGMLRCCEHEGAVAAVLAHEIAHVQCKHGLQAIKKSRITTALNTIAIEGVKSFGDSDLAELTTIFEDSISDITSTMINSGYSRSFEREADKTAITILERLGYGSGSLVDLLEVMKIKLKPGGLDFAKTHPSPDSRINYINELVGGKYSEVKTSPVMQSRFVAALGGI